VQVTQTPIDQLTNQPKSPDGWNIALVSPHFPSTQTENNIHDMKLEIQRTIITGSDRRSEFKVEKN